jgi:hypothetical protein
MAGTSPPSRLIRLKELVQNSKILERFSKPGEISFPI